MGLVFTGTVTNETFSIDDKDGIQYISIKNQSGSSGPITVTGTLSIGSKASSAISVAAGEIVTVTAGNNTVIGSLTIVAASGETADVIAAQ